MRTLIGVAIVLAAVAVESLAQLCLKLGADRGRSAPGSGARGAVAIPALGSRTWLALGVGAYGVEILLYTVALAFLDLSVAFPLGSLCFVGVALLSRVVLGEAVGRVRWVGVGCIVAGAVCVAL